MKMKTKKTPKRSQNSKLLYLSSGVLILGLIVAVAMVNSKELISFLTQARSQGSSCTLTSNGRVVTENGKAKLLYEIKGGGPIQIQADDNAAQPPGVPSVGAPDGGGQGVGEIETGPIKKNTKFTMVVGDGRFNRCSTTVYYTPRPATGWQVGLVKPEPVFTRFQIPGGYETTNGHYPFMAAYWIPGNHFVVNGPANSNAGSRAPSQLKTAAREFESGGMYVLKDDGTFVAAQNVAFDTAVRATGCFELAGCTAGLFIHPTGTNTFIRDLQPREYGYTRSPILYRISGSSLELVNRLFFNDRGIDYSSLAANGDQPGRLSQFKHVAVAGGKMIGVATRYEGVRAPSSSERRYFPNGRDQSSAVNEIYDLNFNFLSRFSKPFVRPNGNVSGAIPTNVPVFYPIVGVGDYVLGTNDREPGYSGAFAPLQVYRMPSTGDLSSGKQPQSVQTLQDGFYLRAYATDVANPNRIALFWLPKGVAVSKAPKMVIYETSENGLKKVMERQLANAPTGPFVSLMNGQMALSGDYLAYPQCNIQPWDGGRGGNNFDACQLIVEKVSDGTLLAVEPLPKAKFTDFGFQGLGAITAESQAAVAVAATPDRKFLVTTYGGGDNGNMYLYQMK